MDNTQRILDTVRKEMDAAKKQRDAAAERFQKLFERGSAESALHFNEKHSILSDLLEKMCDSVDVKECVEIAIMSNVATVLKAPNRTERDRVALNALREVIMLLNRLKKYC